MTHDGFYLRAAVGGVLGKVGCDISEVPIEYAGGGWALDLSVGGAFAGATVILGGTLLYAKIIKPSVDLADGVTSMKYGSETPIGESNPNRDIRLFLLGPFVDVFFSPHGGGHVGAVLGLSNIAFEDDSGGGSNHGYGLGVFGGYDHWVSDQWSLGVNGRYVYAVGTREETIYVTEGDESTEIVSTIGDTAHLFVLSLTALYQ